METVDRRPTLFTLGVILNAAYGALVLVVLVLAAIAVSVGVSVAGVVGSAGALPWLGLGAVIAGAALAFLAALKVLGLWICWLAWKGSRFGIWALLVINALAAISGDPFSIVIGVVTIIGCAQELERERDRAAAGA